ncbi:hypothetical protein CRG98_037378, partial [Punica granatum]
MAVSSSLVPTLSFAANSSSSKSSSSLLPSWSFSKAHQMSSNGRLSIHCSSSSSSSSSPPEFEPTSPNQLNPRQTQVSSLSSFGLTMPENGKRSYRWRRVLLK